MTRKPSSQNGKSPRLWLSNFRAEMRTREERPLSVHRQRDGPPTGLPLRLPHRTHLRSWQLSRGRPRRCRPSRGIPSSFASFARAAPFLQPSVRSLSHQHSRLPSLAFLSPALLLLSSVRCIRSLILFPLCSFFCQPLFSFHFHSNFSPTFLRRFSFPFSLLP